MKRLLLIATLLLPLSCSTPSTSLVSTWKEVSAPGRPIEQILVIGVAQVQGNRYLFEKHFAEALRKRQVEAIPSLEVIPADAELTKQVIKPLIEDRGIDAVLVTRLVSTNAFSITHPETTIRYETPEYPRMYPTLQRIRHEAVMPEYQTDHIEVGLETNLYDVESEKLIWTVTSNTMDQRDIISVTRSMSQVVIRRLAADGFID